MLLALLVAIKQTCKHSSTHSLMGKHTECITSVTITTWEALIKGVGDVTS